jgi:hypothetical protein
MFSAGGSKKIMLDNLRKSKSSGKPIHEVVIATSPPSSSSVPAMMSLPGTPSGPSLSRKSGFSSTQASLFMDASCKPARVRITSESIESDLTRSDNHGTSLRKIAIAVAAFRVDRDGVLLDAFRVKSIEYADFKMLLKRIFALTFSDDEFEYLCFLFDITGDQTIDGPEFLVAVRLLGSAWKAREMRTSRKKEELSDQVQREKEEKEKAEKEAAQENACDPFTEAEILSALEKLTSAAAKYSKTDPAAPSLQAFEVKFLKPAAFKVLLKNTFAIVVNRRELGALVDMFDTEGRGLVDSGAFLLKFSKIGLEQRDLKRKKKIEMTIKAEKDALAYQEGLLKHAQNGLEAVLDANFDPDDEVLRLEKLAPFSVSNLFTLGKCFTQD